MNEPIDLTKRMKKASSKPLERRNADLSHANPHISGDYPLAPQGNMDKASQSGVDTEQELVQQPKLTLVD